MIGSERAAWLVIKRAWKVQCTHDSVTENVGQIGFDTGEEKVSLHSAVGGNHEMHQALPHRTPLGATYKVWKCFTCWRGPTIALNGSGYGWN